MRSFRWLVLVCAPAISQAQPVLRLKVPVDSVPATIEAPPAGRVHFIVQFYNPPTAQDLLELMARGATLLEYIPDNALLVTLDNSVRLTGLGLNYAAPISTTQKISPLIRLKDRAVIPGYYLLEFHRDVDPSDARQVVFNSRAQLMEHPDLRRNHLMVHIPDASHEGETLAALASKDPVAYIFPASAELVAGRPATQLATSSQLVSTVGDGWEGAGQNPVTLFYYFSSITSQLPGSIVKSEILRAMNTWAEPVQLTWLPGTSASGNKTINILFATGDHGDGYPFDGPGGVLAHAYFPSPPNPEPIAGDVHFDDTEGWRIGSDKDVFSVALHELGHALGMGSSDNPDSVMYPYYQLRTSLSDDDKAGIRTLYAARSGTPVPAQLTLTVTAPPASTTAATVSLSGTIDGGSGSVSVTWFSSAGASGTASVNGTTWVAANIPLFVGSNTITVVAADASGSVSRAVSTIRTVTPLPTRTDTTGPTLTITFPSTASFATTQASLLFAGTASDRSGVASVSWSTNTGAAGSATGTTEWTATIPLLVGFNQVIVRAVDSVGNVSSRTVVVTRR